MGLNRPGGAAGELLLLQDRNELVMIEQLVDKHIFRKNEFFVNCV